MEFLAWIDGERFTVSELAAGQSFQASQAFRIESPERWSPRHPALYTAMVEARNDGGADKHVVRFGIHVRNDNRDRMPPLVRLKAVCGPGDHCEPVVTVMMPDED